MQTTATELLDTRASARADVAKYEGFLEVLLDKGHRTQAEALILSGSLGQGLWQFRDAHDLAQQMVKSGLWPRPPRLRRSDVAKINRVILLHRRIHRSIHITQTDTGHHVMTEERPSAQERTVPAKAILVQLLLPFGRP